MTRRSDMMLEDLIGCNHEPETPITQDGEIIYWLCRCGREHWPVKESKDGTEKKEETK